MLLFCAAYVELPLLVQVSMISLQATTPGTDPLVAVKQVGEQNNKMSAVLLNILSHMKMVLLNDYSTSMSMSDAFSTGTQREAARLCCEALLPYAVFKFASDYGLFHIHFGGMRMDVKDEDELRVWREYQETVSRARLEHYTKVLDGVTTLLKPQCFRRFNVPEEEMTTLFGYLEFCLKQVVADNELGALVDALDGKYILPGPGGGWEGHRGHLWKFYLHVRCHPFNLPHDCLPTLAIQVVHYPGRRVTERLTTIKGRKFSRC